MRLANTDKMALVPCDITNRIKGYRVVLNAEVIGDVWNSPDGWQYMTPSGNCGVWDTRRQAIMILVEFWGMSR